MASSLERKSHPKINHAEPEDEITKEEEEESFCYAMQLVGSTALSMSLQSAIKLGVFDIIAREGPGAKLSSSEIAAKIGTKNPEAPMMVDRILRLLTSYSVLNCSAVAANGGSDFQRVYSFAPVSKYFGNDEEGVSLGPVLTLIQDKWILHDWSDEHCLKLLKNCYKAIPDNGKVIVVEALLPAMPDTSTAVKSTSQLDVIMMTQNPGGKERSEQEFMALATGAGFSGIRYECFVCNFWVMEFFK
ncbi:caffeic acid 3-O-methyltransferase-like [Prunus avium]|uniref:Caffeic acid 3-O-methyltransferase-like n=1 Tax=Prunus avium TaxID=42229 RepID=A0A6P5T6D2_PRUAV|nr:caffeic acid 3-O-methyltransferase-like [Prunus avium]